VASTGSVVDFEDMYNLLIAPAVREAGLELVRAEKDPTGGIIYKLMSVLKANPINFEIGRILHLRYACNLRR
jgi:hypothetical protein